MLDDADIRGYVANALIILPNGIRYILLLVHRCIRWYDACRLSLFQVVSTSNLVLDGTVA